MGFNAQKFIKQKFDRRTDDVPVPALAEWFEDGAPVWKVRNLTGEELGRINQAVDQYRNKLEITTKLIVSTESGSPASLVDALKELLGLDDKLPPDIIRRFELIVAGSVDPECDLKLAQKLLETFPIEFGTITTRIMALTGQGSIPGKPKSSGGTRESEPACTSVPPEENSCTKPARTSSRKAT